MERNVTLDFVRGVAILGIVRIKHQRLWATKGGLSQSAWYGAITPQDAWTWAFLDLIGQVKFLTLFALLFGAAHCKCCCPWQTLIQSRLTLLVLLGFIRTVYCSGTAISGGLRVVGLLGWWLVRDAPSGKKPV
ncbi:hypothetical protein ACLK11_12455 [Escherichia coli]